MLDFVTYRMYEDLARANAASWRVTERHFMDKETPLSMTNQIRLFVDGMQEHRFDPFMRELGGLTIDELNVLLDVCREAIIFQQIHFPQHPTVAPLNALLSTLAIYQKISALQPQFRSILEIGPGSGYASLLLKRCHPALETYVQIEAFRGFYLYQHYLNSYCFGNRFVQKIYADPASCVDFYIGEDHGAQDLNDRADIILANYHRPRPLAYQYPWWKIGDLTRNPQKFDLVMSNANLLEFSPVALEDYLKLIRSKLAQNGILFVQCFGGGPRGGEAGIPTALDRLYENGFAPLFLALNHQPKGAPEWAAGSNYLGTTPGDSRNFALGNGVFVAEGHELYSSCHKREYLRDFFWVPIPTIKDAFFKPLEGRRIFQKSEVLKLL